VREHEIRAIIGPNGAGKTSLLNVINGVYHPQQGTITFRGKPRHDMDTHETAALGIARTFQNIALFRGMSVLDNIMTGRNLKMKATVLGAGDLVRRARRESWRTGPRSRRSSISEIQHIRKTPVGRLPAWAAETRSSPPARSRPNLSLRCSTSRWPA
jgi:branched-chain amino acid transport system ATP-binding protein